MTKELDVGLRHETKELEARLRLELAQGQTNLLKWLISLLIAQGGLIVALVKLL